MKTRSLICFCFLALFCVASRAQIQPFNFMIADLTFTRPSSWEWIVPESNTRKAELKIWTEKKNQWSDVVFYLYKPGDDFGKPDSCVKRWVAQFQEKADIKPKVEKITIGTHQVTFAQMEGTYKVGKPVTLLQGHTLYGAIIETAQGNIMIRMTGPKHLAENSIAELKRMIEGALLTS